MADLNWQWTNDERTEARAKRWRVIVLSDGRYNVEHKDFPGTTWYNRTAEYTGDGPGNDIATVLKSFETWNTPQPPEPTTFGFVGTITDARGDVWDVVRDNDDLGLDVAYEWVRRSDGEGHAGS